MKHITPFLCLFSINLFSQPQSMTLTNFSTGYALPVDIAHAGDSRLFIVEQRGKIWIADSNGVKSSQPFLDISSLVSAGGSEQGLLGLAFHPDYKTNGYFFVNYTDDQFGDTYVSRFNVTSNPDVADPFSEDIVIMIEQDFSNHNGGCIKFGDDGYLYIGMGDGGSGGDPFNRAQDPGQLLGKMLRLDIDVDSGYALPADNPFIGSLTIRNEIWAMGLRNPWRFSFDRLTQDMWIGDVGQGSWEEIDFEGSGSTGGNNWGWRCYEGFHPYNTSGCQAASFYDDPVFDYPHDTSGNCSVTGGYVYRGARFASMWGSYIFTDYCSGRTWALRSNGTDFDTTFLGDRSNYQYSTYGEDACGELYLARLGSGAIQRVEDTTCTPVAFITTEDSISVCPGQLEAFCGRGVSYEWFLNDTVLVGTTRVLAPTTPGWYRVRASRGNCSSLSDSVYVTITSPPIVDFTMSDTSFVTTDPAVTLTASPPGGTFSGPGVTGDIFDPNTAGPGTFTLVYTYTDSNGCSAWDDVTVVVDFVGIDGPLNQSVHVFPNPATKEITVSFGSSYSGPVTLTLYDAVGKVALNQAAFMSHNNPIVIPLAAVESGFYVLHIDTGHDRAVKKIMIGSR